MYELTNREIFLRLILSMIFSGLIGYERDKNNSSAGLKTHILVSMGATIISLIQVDTIYQVATMNVDSKVRVDAVRLIAQVVSGIGFLGAGTIMTTKRSIVGLTTAASIWGVSGIGLALGMGYYQISLIGSILMFSVLIFFKKFFIVHGPEQVLLKFIYSERTENKIKSALKDIDPGYEILRMNTDVYNDTLIKTYIFRLKLKHNIKFNEIANELSKIDRVMSIEPTEIIGK